MSQKVFIAGTLIICLMMLGSCDASGGGPPEPQPEDSTKESNSIVGTWYQVGSTENIGVKVTFTETTLTAYAYDDRYPEDMWKRWYDNVDYSIISKNEIKLSGLPLPYTWSRDDGTHITEFTLDNDTLIIDHFIQYFIHVLYPLNMGGIALIREWEY
ncbi:MAG: hypothetical protein FWG85_02125 [Bacteroidetes bacterium]|nr:hypothetical protein [Bacteroidota bacterium]